LIENHYHHGYDWARMDQLASALKHPGLQKRAQELVERGLTGNLTNSDVHRLFGGGSFSIGSLPMRDPYTALVSWALYTTEYRASLERLLRGKRVLEVCAGRGTLAKHMRARGINWRATDEKPINGLVEKCDALAAVFIYKSDVIFASWIPYGSDLDAQIAELGIPMVLIGESLGGCTGSEEFWHRGQETYWDWEADGEVENDHLDWNIHDASSAFPWFKDVPRWGGILDYTSIVVPRGSAFLVESKGVFGPPV